MLLAIGEEPSALRENFQSPIPTLFLRRVCPFTAISVKMITVLTRYRPIVLELI